MAILLSLLLSLFVSIPQTSGLHTTSVRIPTLHRIAQDADSNFSIVNETTVNVGWAAITLSNNSYTYIDVSGAGTFYATLAYQPTACVINGQSLGYGTAAWIQVDSHTAVHATWTTNVIVIDTQEQY